MTQTHETIINYRGIRYVRRDVVSATYRLLKLQKQYFKTRDKAMLKECKRIEDAIMLFCENNELTGEVVQYRLPMDGETLGGETMDISKNK